jgi:pimeloyl-ACP methyl ester carboxylesterase
VAPFYSGDRRIPHEEDDTVSYADVNGISLYYEEHGSGQPLVLLHGGLAAGSMYAPILPELAKGRRVILVDLQAHGHTADVDRPLRYETMADDIAGLIRHLGLEQADVMGYSFGAATAVRTAIQHPVLVRRLVIVSLPFRRDGWYPESRAGMDQMGSQLADVLKQGPLYDSYAAAAPRVEDWPVLLDKAGELLRRDYDWSADLARITAPAMLVYADADAIIPSHIVDFYARLGGGLRDASWDGSARSVARLAVLPGQTHYDIFGSPALAAAVIPFLDADSLEPPAPMAP